MSPLRRILVVALSLLLAVSALATGRHVVRKNAAGGDGGWDYAVVENAATEPGARTMALDRGRIVPDPGREVAGVGRVSAPTAGGAPWRPAAR